LKFIHRDRLNILHLNVRGLRTKTKYTLFTHLLTQLNIKPDIIFINEHWLDKHEVQSFFVKGYYLAASYGRGKKAQGGSLILVKEFLKPHVKKIVIKSVELKFEICGANLEINNTKLLLVSLYRPSNPTANTDISGFFENLENFLEKHRGVHDIILAGDLNLNLLNCDTNAKLLIDIFHTYNMSLVNANQITRVNGNINGGTLIDHIFTSVKHNSDFQVLDYDCSDHRAITAALDIPLIRPKDFFKQVRKFSPDNWETFLDLLVKENWEEVYNETDIDAKSELFMDKIIKYFNVAFPLHKTVVRANQINKVNLSAPTRLLKNRILSLDNEIKSTLSEFEKIRLKNERATLQKQVSNNIREEVKNKNHLTISNSSNKSSAAWKILKDSTGKGKSQHEITRLKVDGREETIKLNIANLLNQTFLVPPPNETPQSSDYTFDPPEIVVPFSLNRTSENEIYAIICKLAPKKSSGWDEISVQTLKRISLFIVKPFSHLVNYSFITGKVPKNIKLAKYIPVFKKGDSENPSNYRPIAMTSSFSKVYEKAFLNRLEYHFEHNNIINPQQHGFRKGKSTLTALFDFAEQVYNTMGAREKLNVILYDFSNAFGTLYPQLLLRKLKLYGVSDVAISWLSSFLMQREQYVQIRDVDCDGTEITINSERLISDMGVPQGTILGPTSFISYSNDISLRVLIAILILFADDSTMLVKGKTSQEVNTNTVQVNNDFVGFASDNLLTINASKTKIMQMHTYQTKHIVPPEIAISGTNVEVVNNCRLLGVTISDTMNWLPQCEKVVNKLRSVTYLFTILRDTVSEDSLKLVYYAYAQSQIMYSIVIWGASPHMQKVFVAQKRVVRALAGLRYWRSNCALDSCRPLFKKYGILTVYSLYILECMKFFAKYPEKFRRKSEVPNCYSPKTRLAKSNSCENDLYVDISGQLDILNQNPVVMTSRIFNMLPVTVKMLTDRREFICKIKEIVYKYQYYDMNEYFTCKFEM
jgi:Reverse transcriptase (RNA-dependent DNA polymerase)/Endonuclease-reverse transcriptase